MSNSYSNGSAPLVSIVIPVYNGADYLATAIESALDQTWPHREILVIDDGSNDGGRTAAVIASFGDSITVVSKPNGGVASALNAGIGAMHGELFSWLSHDDVYAPDKLAREVAAYLHSGRDAVIFSDHYVIDASGARLHDHRVPTIPASGMRCLLAESSAVHGCTLLVPRRFLLAAGGFDPALKTTQDYDMWFRLASEHPFVHVRAPLVGVRFHAAQATTRMVDLVRGEQDSLYCRFLGALSDEEVESCSRGGPVRFFCRLLTKYSASGLHCARRIALERVLAALSQKRSSPSGWARLGWTLAVSVPLTRARVLLRQLLFRQDAHWLIRLLMVARRPFGSGR